MADNINEVSKKRKRVIKDDDDDDDEELATEEQQIDKFYALIRSMREARDRLIMINQSNQAENKDHDLKHVHNINTDIKRRKAEELEKKEPPSFQRGGFINTNNIPEVLFKVPKAVTFVDSSSSSSSSSSNSHVIGAVRSDEKKDRQISTKDDLDLTLSL